MKPRARGQRREARPVDEWLRDAGGSFEEVPFDARERRMAEMALEVAPGGTSRTKERAELGRRGARARWGTGRGA